MAGSNVIALGDELRPIPGLDGYTADELGNIYSSRSGSVRRLTAALHNEYLHVQVRTRPGRENQRKMPVHQLVLFAFSGPKPFSEAVTRHLDGNRLNNRSSNLCWGTAAENRADSLLHGTSIVARFGDAHPRTIVGDAQVIAVRAALSEGQDASRLAADLGVTADWVKRIGSGRARIPKGA